MADLMEVYAEAAEVILERGYAPEYVWKKDAPVDLPRALGLAQKRVGYSGREECPVILLSQWVGDTLSHASTRYTKEEAVALFMWAARNADTLHDDPTNSPVRLPPLNPKKEVADVGVDGDDMGV